MSLDVTRAELRPHEARQRLEHARASRLAQLQALGETAQSVDGHLLAEQRSAAERDLKEIGEAFARIETGAYGSCLGCAKPIPVERLEILPYTRYCVPCQRRAT